MVILIPKTMFLGKALKINVKKTCKFCGKHQNKNETWIFQKTLKGKIRDKIKELKFVEKMKTEIFRLRSKILKKWVGLKKLKRRSN